MSFDLFLEGLFLQKTLTFFMSLSDLTILITRFSFLKSQLLLKRKKYVFYGFIHKTLSEGSRLLEWMGKKGRSSPTLLPCSSQFPSVCAADSGKICSRYDAAATCVSQDAVVFKGMT